MDHAIVYLFLACLIALTMTFGIGANDLANVLSTSLGSRAVTLRQAIIIAIIFEFAGALLGGKNVSHTISTALFNFENFEPLILVQGLISVLLATMIWINAASILGLPVSITHATIGALVGFGLVELGKDAIHWDSVATIGLSWLFAPAISGVVAYLLFNSIQRLILGCENPLEQAKRYIGIYLFLIGIILSNMILLKGLSHFGYNLSLSAKIFLNLGSSFFIVLLGNFGIVTLPDLRDTKTRLRLRFVKVEKMFGILMAFTACAMVFAHGSNDVAVAVGPVLLILSVLQDLGGSQPLFFEPNSLLIFGCIGVITGLLLYGRKVIATVGHNITALTPSRAFAATLAAASTVVVATSVGIPVSATQTLVGGVLGVGLARGIGALNLNVIRNIFMSWIITLPVTSALAIGCFYLIQGLSLIL